ncbi:hypothetical protein M3665_28445, partial [Bacillus licheniformis]|nr:hypothetical protein [Bacillus licheniformis]
MRIRRREGSIVANGTMCGDRQETRAACVAAAGRTRTAGDSRTRPPAAARLNPVIRNPISISCEKYYRRYIKNNAR